MTGRRRASLKGSSGDFRTRVRLGAAGLGGPRQAALVLDAPGAIQGGQRDGASVVTDLDYDAPRPVVDTELGLGPAPAQTRDEAGLVGGQLERHATSIGTKAEGPNNAR